MSDDQCKAESPRERRRRAFRSRLTVHAYQVPGYGPTYRWVQKTMHRRGRCVLTRDLILHDDGRQTWRCRWCGHMSTDSAWTVRVNRAKDETEKARLLRERIDEMGREIAAKQQQYDPSPAPAQLRTAEPDREEK